eukprot:Em0009g1277a
MASVLVREVEAVRERQNCCMGFDSLDSGAQSDETVRVPAVGLEDDENDRAATAPQSDDMAHSSEPSELDAETSDKIRKQVEFYFSEENLKKDSFLMKHIQRNKQGYVSLKLVSSFRKIKSLTKDWRVVLESVKRSQLLALNDDETKIRRVEPVNRLDYSHLARTVIVTKYTVDTPEVAALERVFGKCGEVKSVRILHPGKAVPLDVKPARVKHTSIGNELCILVEYATEQEAKRACAEWSAENCWRRQMVVELLDKLQSTRNAQDQSKGNGDKQKQSGDKKTQESHNTSRSKPRQVPDGNHRKLSGAGRHGQDDSDWRKSSRDESDKLSHSDTWLSDSGFSSKSPSESPKNSPASSKKFFTDSHCWRALDRQAFVVLRQPLGPDGTRGFHWIKASA